MFFLSVFLSFSRDFRGSVGIKNPCFLGGFPCLFLKKKKKTRKGRTGLILSDTLLRFDSSFLRFSQGAPTCPAARKIKKAFCQPGHTEFCPPVEWVKALLPYKPELLLTRKPDNGGDKTYRQVGKIKRERVCVWHVCRVNFARKIFFALRIFSRKMLRNFPRKF